MDKINIFIGTHSKRLRCFVKQYFHNKKLELKFKNCSILKISPVSFGKDEYYAKIEMIHDGYLDPNEFKLESNYYKIDEFNKLGLKSYKLCIPDNANIYLIRHAQGYHNINSSIFDKIILLFNPKHLIDPFLTEVGQHQAKLTGQILNNYLINKGETEYKSLFCCSKLLRTRETLSTIMNQIKKNYNSIYIIPCAHELIFVESYESCDDNNIIPDFSESLGVTPKTMEDKLKYKYYEIDNKQVIWTYYNKFYHSKNKKCKNTNMIYETYYIISDLVDEDTTLLESQLKKFV